MLVRDAGWYRDRTGGSDRHTDDALLALKTPYVGNNSKVVHIIDSLPLSQYRQKVALQTKTAPYGITVGYDCSRSDQDSAQIERALHSNAAMMFALIGNVDQIDFDTVMPGTSAPARLSYSRAVIQKEYPIDLREYTNNQPSFQSFIKAVSSSGKRGAATSIDDAVSRGITSASQKYGEGETAAEGHIILKTVEDQGIVTVYTIASLGVFGFENGIFTVVSGTGAIPTVMTFKKSPEGGYSLLKYQEPQDGSGNVESLKKMFPISLWNRVLSGHEDYPALQRQQETQARAYLQTIGRKAMVNAAHVEKRMPTINTEASNKLFAEFTKNDAFLNNCPYWLGTRERVENGQRFIYETAQSKAADGADLMIYRKTAADGKVIQERTYKIVGTEPQQIQ